MPGRILGIDINDDFIAAVQVVSGLKNFQVLSRSFVRIDKNKTREDALKELAQKFDLRCDTCMASISGGLVSCRNLALPFKDPKKIKQTLPFEMENLIPSPIEDVVIDFNIIKNTEQSEILAVSASKSLISEYLKDVKSVGLSPNLVDIRPVPITLWLLAQDSTPDNGLLIDIGLQRIAFVFFLNRRIALVRNLFSADGAGFVDILDGVEIQDDSRKKAEAVLESIPLMIKNTARAFTAQTGMELNPEKIFLTGIGSQYPGITGIISELTAMPAEQIDISKDKIIRMDSNMTAGWNPGLMDGALSLALREIKKGHGFNLLKAEFAGKKSLFKEIKEYRTAGILVLAILIFLAVDFGVDYHFVKKKYQAAEQRCLDLFKQSFPDAGDVKDPVKEMIKKIDELKKSTISTSSGFTTNQKVLDILNDISKRIPKDMDCNVSKMVIDSDTVLITGETDTFDTFNTLKSNLASSPYFSDVLKDKPNLDKSGERVAFDIKFQRAK